MPSKQSRQRRRRRLAATTILAVLTAGVVATSATGAGATVVRPARSVSVQDAVDADDPRADLRSATVSVSRNRRLLTVTAHLEQPTSPTSQNWWRGLSLPRGGISWGLNSDPASGDWSYVAELRGDPVLGAYGYVERRQDGTSQLACRAKASFDGTRYQLRFPASCIGNPDRVRFTAYAQLYDDAGAGIIGGDYAPAWAELSDWLSIR
jgi:hypothetical protein